MNESNNKTILITAPGGGVGKSITRYLIDDGYRVIGLGGKGSQNYVKNFKIQESTFFSLTVIIFLKIQYLKHLMKLNL